MVNGSSKRHGRDGMDAATSAKFLILGISTMSVFKQSPVVWCPFQRLREHKRLCNAKTLSDFGS